MLSRREALLLTLAGLLPAQEPTFSTSTSLVNILATVRDKRGRLLADLTRDDFALEEEHRPQTIRYFERNSEMPLVLGILMDMSASQVGKIGAQAQAGRRFLRKVLRPQTDKAFLIQFEDEVELLQDATVSLTLLDDAFNKLAVPPNDQPSGPGPTLGPGARRGGTALYDAITLAADEVMAAHTGRVRKALIVLTDGNDTVSKLSLLDATAAALRADTLVYAIRFAERGDRWLLPDGDGKEVLRDIATDTGGASFESGRSLDDVFARIEEELRTQYSIGYTPPTTGPEYRRIDLKCKRPGTRVNARAGYFATPQQDRQAAKPALP